MTDTHDTSLSNQIGKCPICNRDSSDGFACMRCDFRIHSQLDDLLELWDAAHYELTPGKGGHGSHSSERTIGLNVSALSFIAGDDILHFLHDWERIIRADRQLTPPALLPKHGLVDEISNSIAFHKAHLDWSTTQPWIADYARELAVLHGTGMAAARRFVERVRRIPCPADNAEGLPCGNLLVVREDDLLAIFECRRCGSEWNSFRLISVALSDPASQFWLDTEAIAAWLGVTERRVRQIAKEHNIAKRGQLLDFKAIIQARTELVS